MRVHSVICFAVAAAAFTPFGVVGAQQAAAQLAVNAPAAPRTMTDLLMLPPPSVATLGISSPVTGQPFALTEKQTTVRTGPDGTRFTSYEETRKYRDAQGRTRVTKTMIRADGSSWVLRDSIEDPVARQRISLNTTSKTAMLYRYPAAAPAAKTAEPVSPEKLAELKKKAQEHHESFKAKYGEFVREKLSGKQIAGIYAEGERTTQTVPAGAQENDREFKVITETWTSPDLKIALYYSLQDPRIGTTTTEVADLSRTDPDPSVFQVPEGYKVRDITPKSATLQ
ncbi:MAG: hypothetical protein P4L10_00515 [Acidobacteriaceae bacterium]|nr:hypothetical protein [Acidobacteriaceae bacterium]